MSTPLRYRRAPASHALASPHATSSQSPVQTPQVTPLRTQVTQASQVTPQATPDPKTRPIRSQPERYARRSPPETGTTPLKTPQHSVLRSPQDSPLRAPNSATSRQRSPLMTSASGASSSSSSVRSGNSAVGSSVSSATSSPAMGSSAMGTPAMKTPAKGIPAMTTPKLGSSSPALGNSAASTGSPSGRHRLADFSPHQSAIERLLAATASVSPAASPASRTVSRTAATAAAASLVSVTVRLPSREVTKHILPSLTAQALAAQLVREHRLEFEFGSEEDGSEDDVLIWESCDGTRRPLRPEETVVAVVRRWGRTPRCFLRTTSTALRHDVDSLASLVPRRDMLRTPPTLLGADVHFSRPSVLYNPHGRGSNRNGPSSPNGNDSGSYGGELTRHPSKLNPSDQLLRATRRQGDTDDAELQTQLVWGFGSLDLSAGRVVLKQKPGDELVCALEAASAEVYEWPHRGPKKYVVVLKTAQLNARAVYLSTDSAKVFSVLRNAVFTARSRALRDEQLR